MACGPRVTKGVTSAEMSIVALCVAVAAAVAAFLTWSVSREQFRASDCSALILETEPEPIEGGPSAPNWRPWLRGGVVLTSVPVLAVVKNVGRVAAVWWGWRLERWDHGVSTLNPLFGTGQAVEAGKTALVPMLGDLSMANAQVWIYSQGPSGTEWKTKIRIENGRQTDIEVAREKGSKPKFINEANETAERRKASLQGAGGRES